MVMNHEPKEQDGPASGWRALNLQPTGRTLTTTNRFARRLLGVYQTVLRSPVWLNS